MLTLGDPAECPPERDRNYYDTLNARVDLPPPRSPRRMVAACRPAGRADQRHEDVALLVSEVSPTRSSTPEVKPAWSWRAQLHYAPRSVCMTRQFFTVTNPHSHGRCARGETPGMGGYGCGAAGVAFVACPREAAVAPSRWAVIRLAMSRSSRRSRRLYGRFARSRGTHRAGKRHGVAKPHVNSSRRVRVSGKHLHLMMSPMWTITPMRTTSAVNTCAKWRLTRRRPASRRACSAGTTRPGSPSRCRSPLR